MNPCQKIQNSYNSLISAKLKLDLLFSGDLRQADRLEFIKQAREIIEKNDFKGMFADIQKAGGNFFEADNVTLRKINRLAKKLDIDPRLELRVEDGWVCTDTTFTGDIGNDIVKALCRLITHPESPITKLNFFNKLMDPDVFDIFSEALKHPMNKVIALNLRRILMGMRKTLQISEVLENPNNKLEILDLTACSIKQGAANLLFALKAPDCRLKELYLAKNHLSEDIKPVLIDVLARPESKLEMIDLSDIFSLRQSRVQIIKEVGKHNPKLRIIF